MARWPPRGERRLEQDLVARQGGGSGGPDLERGRRGCPRIAPVVRVDTGTAVRPLTGGSRLPGHVFDSTSQGQSLNVTSRRSTALQEREWHPADRSGKDGPRHDEGSCTPGGAPVTLPRGRTDRNDSIVFASWLGPAR